jgi:hypothetical protein
MIVGLQAGGAQIRSGKSRELFLRHVSISNTQKLKSALPKRSRILSDRRARGELLAKAGASSEGGLPARLSPGMREALPSSIGPAMAS